MQRADTAQDAESKWPWLLSSKFQMGHLYYSLWDTKRILEEGVERMHAPEFGEEYYKTVIFWVCHAYCSQELTEAVHKVRKRNHDVLRVFTSQKLKKKKEKMSSKWEGLLGRKKRLGVREE